MSGFPFSKLPRLIALCGHPGSGKSTAAEILHDHFGYTIADDGLPLRRIAMQHLGLSQDQVFTQQGKLETVDLLGRKHQVRSILGEIGNALEDKFGPDIIPYMVERTFAPDHNYVMASVRRDQGVYWASRGALVVQIVNPQTSPSLFDFDRYNADAIHTTIVNEGLALGLSPEMARNDLRRTLYELLNTYPRGVAA